MTTEHREALLLISTAAQPQNHAMTNKLKAAAMFRVLSLAPMKDAAPPFRQLAQDGKVDQFRKLYEGCMRTMPDGDEQIEKGAR